jgi:hypothetical protein
MRFGFDRIHVRGYKQHHIGINAGDRQQPALRQLKAFDHKTFSSRLLLLQITTPAHGA